MTWLGLGAGGTIPTPPAGFQNPTPQAFVAGFTNALDGIDDAWARENLSVPVGAAVPLIKSTVSAAGDLNFGQIARAASEGRISPAQVKAISGALSGLVAGSLKIAQAMAAGTRVADTVSDVGEAIPVIGAIITWIVDLALGVASSSALIGATENEAERRLHDDLNTMCAGWARADQPYGPGSLLTPADIFRKLGYTYQGWGGSGSPPELPLNASSMYVMLCGGETQGFGLPRQRYEELVAKARAKNPKIGGGIPRSVQRQMWKLIKGIMANAEPPISQPPVGDQGRMLMAVLQDVVREYNLRASATEPGSRGPGWDGYLASLLSDEVTKRYRHNVHITVGAGVVQRSSSCAGQQHGYGRHMDLGPLLINSVARYQQALFDEFWDTSSQQWSTRPNTPIAGVAKTGTLVMSAEGSKSVAGSVGRITRPSRSPLIVGSAAVASALAGYYAARGGYKTIAKALGL